MREGTPSRTAMGVARRRAAHQLLEVPRVLDDPLALAIVGRESADALRADPHAFDRSPLDAFLRASVVARSRFAEDTLAQAAARGVRQYVLLGAGLDTFAYRNPHAGVRVFEVDHPDTQLWKRWRLSEGGIAIPQSITFAPVNFESETLAHGLAAAGFDRGAPAIFAMLGVVMYLTLDALDATWGYVGSGAQGGGLVFDYSIPGSMMTDDQRAAAAALAARVAAAGEPFRTAFAPDDLARRLASLGFTAFEDLDGAAINGRYFANRTDGFRVGGVARLMKALV